MGRITGTRSPAPKGDDLDTLEQTSGDDNDPLKDVVTPPSKPAKRKGETKVSTNPQHIAAQQRIVHGMGKASSHVQPPIVYAAIGTVCGFFWLLGTSVQVLTSEAWMMGRTLDKISFNAFGQLWDAARGLLPGNVWIPFVFGWGVQMALVVTSIGVELPKKPAWRWWLSAGSCFVLIIANSCGDFFSAAQYGFWGQLGFTAVVFFLTFVMLIFAIMAFRHAFALAKAAQQQL